MLLYKKSIGPFIRTFGVFLVFTFLIFGMWEWLQIPFYNESHKSLNQVIWNRLHCTGGDILILIFSLLFSSISLRKNLFLFDFGKKDYVLTSIVGVIYTSVSEYINVHIHQSWTYSSLMPLAPFSNVGIVPLI